MKQNDPRPDEMKREMAQNFAAYEADYRDADWCSVVYEDDKVVLIADHKGYEFDEWSDEFADQFTDREFSQMMHNLADQLCDRRWPADYPVVFDKLE